MLSIGLELRYMSLYLITGRLLRSQQQKHENSFLAQKFKKKIGWLTNDEKNLIANDLGVKTRDVETMEQRLASKDVLFDRPDDDNDSYVSPAGFLPAPNSDPSRLVEKENWLESNIELLSEAMDNLDNRGKEVLKLRWLTEEKVTLKELARNLMFP